MKIAPPESQEQLEELRERLRCGLPVKPGTYWDVMIYKCRWGWVVRAQLRRTKGLKDQETERLKDQGTKRLKDQEPKSLAPLLLLSPLVLWSFGPLVSQSFSPLVP